jgi:hypothetical protein
MANREEERVRLARRCDYQTALRARIGVSDFGEFTMNEFNYGFGKQGDMTFDGAIERVVDALQTEGFGVLSDIDVAATLKKKLDEDMPP